MIRKGNVKNCWKNKTAIKLETAEKEVLLCDKCKGEDFVQFGDTDHYVCTNCHSVYKVS